MTILAVYGGDMSQMSSQLVHAHPVIEDTSCSVIAFA